MRPVTKAPAPAPGYNSAMLSHNFIAPVPAVLTGLGFASPAGVGPTFDTIAQALEHFRNNPPAVGTNAQTAYNRLRDFALSPPTNQGYKVAVIPLRNDLGGTYCSYCECLDETTALAVEHVVPKADFPSWVFDWNNFLLGCPTCNSSFKRDNPDRATVGGWGGVGAPNPTEAQLQTRILTHYRWPHRAASSYRGVRYKLYRVNPGGGVTEITGPTAVTGVRNAVVLNNTVTALVRPAGAGLGAWPRREIVVRVVPRPHAAPPVPQELINLTGLNERSPGGGDYRVSKRTQAWVHAAEAVQNLREGLVGAANPALSFNTGWFAIKQGPFAGYYSVWLSVLERAGVVNGINLAQRFINDTTGGPNPLFPGTNAALL